MGLSHNEEAKRKLREFRKGRKHSKETLKKMSEAHKGKKLSEKTKKKMSEAMKGKIPWIKGKKHKEETRKKISDAGKRERHSNWKGGISENPYPREFNPELKLKIRQRDNFTCCLCGRTEREELEELNRALSINHIDFYKNNCNENNLNTLCLRCNVKINRERDYWTNYFNNQRDRMNKMERNL